MKETHACHAAGGPDLSPPDIHQTNPIMKKRIAFVATALMLSACGQKLTGTYADKDNMLALTFESGGKVLEHSIGPDMELNYEMDGDKVKLQTPQGTMVLTMKNDGSIAGPTGLMKKQDK